jgi:enoyl-[acyl-carrier protein] reductase II
MRGITLGEMAAAVSNSGGFGQIAASGLPADRLRREIERARSLTQRPFGVNIPIYRPNAEEALEVAIEMGVRTVTTSAGNLAKLIGRIKEAGLRVLHKVSTVEMGLRAQEAGVDGVIAMGYEAGGHLGRGGITTLCLVPQLVDALEVPVVAAGGIADGRGLLAALALGAEGVEVGTRLLATHECPVPESYKRGIVEAPCDGTVVIGDGRMPLRVLRTKAAERLLSGHADSPPEPPKEAGALSSDASVSEVEEMILPAGQISGLLREVLSIGDLISGMIRQAKEVLEGLHERLLDRQDPP